MQIIAKMALANGVHLQAYVTDSRFPN
jgi:hypothetical protein